MADQEILSYDDAYARTEAIFDELSPALPDGFSREVLLLIVAEAALSRLNRKAPSAASLDRQIRFVTRLLIDEAACSPLDAKVVLRMAVLDDATDQQLSRAFDDDHSERHREFSLNFANMATLTLSKGREARERVAAVRKSTVQSTENWSLAKAIEEGNRRVDA
ncbi:hypothetical protein ACIGGE_12355 [Qipengyuania sp. NPDC077410]|uniref:hypothetical protein n=1 Tax=Qipengyuania sp. NPDC077410 TaxID=3364496 RepID=UPI0037C936C0